MNIIQKIKDAIVIRNAKKNIVYKSDIYPEEMMKIASEIRQELARENPDDFLMLMKIVENDGVA